MRRITGGQDLLLVSAWSEKDGSELTEAVAADLGFAAPGALCSAHLGALAPGAVHLRRLPPQPGAGKAPLFGWMGWGRLGCAENTGLGVSGRLISWVLLRLCREDSEDSDSRESPKLTPKPYGIPNPCKTRRPPTGALNPHPRNRPISLE